MSVHAVASVIVIRILFCLPMLNVILFFCRFGAENSPPLLPLFSFSCVCLLSSRFVAEVKARAECVRKWTFELSPEVLEGYKAGRFSLEIQRYSGHTYGQNYPIGLV